MSDALGRLIGRAEVGIADFSKRTVNNITTPIRVKSQEIVTETLETVTQGVKTILVKAVLGLIAAAMLLVAVIYAVAALYQELLPILGPVQARLVMAGVFALIGVIAILVMVFWPKPKPTATRPAARQIKETADEVKRAAANTRADVVRTTQTAEQQARLAAVDAALEWAPESPADLKTGFETIVAVLGDAGFRREQAGLRAGLALASQLKPMQIVTLSLIGGFIAGFRYPRR